MAKRKWLVMTLVVASFGVPAHAGCDDMAFRLVNSDDHPVEVKRLQMKMRGGFWGDVEFQRLDDNGDPMNEMHRETGLFGYPSFQIREQSTRVIANYDSAFNCMTDRRLRVEVTCANGTTTKQHYPGKSDWFAYNSPVTLDLGEACG